MTAPFTESDVEEAALSWLEESGWTIRHGAEMVPGELFAERDDYGQAVLAGRLRDALARLNPNLQPEALDDAFHRLMRPEGADLVARNRHLHRLMVDGVTVEYRATDGGIRGAQARVIDFEHPKAKRSRRRRSSRPAGPNWRPWWAPNTAWNSSPVIWWSTSSAAKRLLRAKPWWSA